MGKEEILKMFFRQADALGSRSTTLNPIAWLIVILLAGVFSSFHLNNPIWVSKTFTIFTGIAVLLYIIAYLYFMFTDPNALRTEKFTLRKMEIEKGFFGDNITGQINRDSVSPSGAIDYNAKKEKEAE